MAKMKDKLIEILKDKSLTVNEIASELGFDDTFIVVSMLAELEYIDKKVMLDKFKTCYDPGGSAFYLAKYKLVE